MRSTTASVKHFPHGSRPNTLAHKLGLESMELTALTERSDVRGMFTVLSVWVQIACIFSMMAGAWIYFDLILAVPVIAIGVVLLAGRQLALAIVMHEAAHRTLFKTPWFNDVFTNWFSAKVIWNDVHKFRAHHLVHHSNTMAEFDPDRPVYGGLPVSKASLVRKFGRDLAGLTGLKFLLGRSLMSAGYLQWSDAAGVKAEQPPENIFQGLVNFCRDVWPTALTNGLMFLVLYASGHAWLYACWALAYLIPFMVFVRIRGMAEHACLEECSDTFKNTRTTRAGWLARVTVAPVHVNFHMEHHLLASTPHYRLAKLHKILRNRGKAPAPPSYIDVLQLVGSGPNSLSLSKRNIETAGNMK